MNAAGMAKALMLTAALAALLAAAGGAEETASDAGQAPRGLCILDFASAFDSGETGAKVGYSLRAKLRRSGRFEIPDELDIEEAQAAGMERPAPDDLAGARAIADRFGSPLVVWGEVTNADGYTVSASAVDLSVEPAVRRFTKTAATQRELALICSALADELALAFTGEGYREVYPSFSTEGYARAGPNLVANGDFEKGASSPGAWEAVDGLCSFWESEPGRGRFIRFDTDVYLSQWQEWRKRFAAGEPASAAPEKAPTSGPKYDTVAGTYGVHLYSEAIAVKPGATYSIEFDAKGRMAGDFFFAKVFVKAYGAQGESMELYRMYKAVRVAKAGEWEHFSRIFHPTLRTPGVAFMKVMLFAYWPPGEYAFDNIAIYEVKPEAEAAKPEPGPAPAQ